MLRRRFLLTLQGGYRWLRAMWNVRIGRTAKMDDAPAKTIAADSEFYSKKEADLTITPVHEARIDRTIQISKLAALVAYIRAAVVYISKILTGRYAKLSSAPGAGTKYEEEFQFVRRSEAGAADSAIMGSQFNTISHSYEAAGSSAPAHIVPAIEENTFSAEHTATASTGTAVAVNIDSLSKVTHIVKMATWIDPVVVDGVLILRQVYSATPKNNVLVVE